MTAEQAAQIISLLMDLVALLRQNVTCFLFIIGFAAALLVLRLMWSVIKIFFSKF